jgi:hypothetical protein
MVIERSVVVETRTVVRVKVRGVEETREKTDGSQAVTMPPRLPSASREEKQERREGRNERSLPRESAASFDSWMQATEGLASVTASRTITHLSSSPTP